MSGAATLAPGTAATPCTLNRTGLGTPQTAQVHRCKKIVAHDEHIDNLLVDLVMDRNYKAPEQPALTVDTTDSVGTALKNPPTGNAATCRWTASGMSPYNTPVCGAPVRTPPAAPSSNYGGSWAGSAGAGRGLRSCCPGDTGVCRGHIMIWSECDQVDYLLDLARDTRVLWRAHWLCRQRGWAVRKYA